jgi:hypothetical protein
VARRFHEDFTSRCKLLIGPVGTGKTTSAAYDQILLQSGRVMPDANGVRRTKYAIIRNTNPQLKDSTMRTVLDWFPPHLYGTLLTSDKTYTINFVADDGPREVELVFRALDLEKDSRNLLSVEYTGAWIDEAREIKHSLFLYLLSRLMRYPSKKDFNNKSPFIYPGQVLLTTNYPSREHWLYKMFVESPQEGYSIYEQSQSENAHNLPENYYENLERDYKDRPDLLKTLVRGEWGVTVMGRQVYPEYNKEFHVATEPLLPLVQEGMAGEDGKKTVVRGWDHTGLSPAAVVVWINHTGQALVIKEFLSDDEPGIVDFGEMVQSWCAENLPGARYVDIGDPAGRYRDSTKMSPRDYLKEEFGIVIHDGIQTFKVRRESVAGRLNKQINGAPALVICPSCVRLIDGFEGGYAYGEYGRTGTFKSEPAKNEYSHVHDALQYPFTVLFTGYGRDVEEEYEPRQDFYANRRGQSEVTGY